MPVREFAGEVRAKTVHLPLKKYIIQPQLIKFSTESLTVMHNYSYLYVSRMINGMWEA
jgi:hypothetical protein